MDMEYKYYLSLLNEKERYIYLYIYDRLSQNKDVFRVDADLELIHKVVKAIMLDNPELFWFEGKWRADTDFCIIQMLPNYKSCIKNKTELVQYIEQEIDSILCVCEGSRMDCIKKVYDWLIFNVEYDFTRNDQTIEGVFIDKKAVCKGIAKAFQICMNKMEIPSFLVEGTLDGQTIHVWNMVYLDGFFYHVDVTMGYQRFAHFFQGMNRNKFYPCFLVSDQTILMTHKIYHNCYPECMEDYDINAYLVKQLNVPQRFLKYDVVKYLDKGSTCQVLQLTNADKNHVLKIIELSGLPDNSIFIRRELEILNELSDCKNVVHLIDSEIDSENQIMYLLLEYAKPLSVRRRERDFHFEKDTLQLGVDVLQAMIECHKRKIYHLDIQPKNIYYDNTNRAVLADFGNARYEHELNEVSMKVGTIAFLAPEVYNEGKYGQASEIYSLGIVLYSLLNEAKLPFTDKLEANKAIELRLFGEELQKPCNCDEEFWKCIKKMCAYDMRERYHTYEQVQSDLLLLL